MNELEKKLGKSKFLKVYKVKQIILFTVQFNILL